MRVSLTQSTRVIEKNLDLIEREKEIWYKSEKVAHMRNVMKDLNNSSMKNVDEHIELLAISRPLFPH